MKTKKILIYILLSLLIFTPICNANNEIIENVEPYSIKNNTENANSEENILNKKLNILSESVILIDNKTGAEIYSKDADKRMNPASTTKVLTAILAIENSNLDDIATTSQEAISLIPYGYSAAYLLEGEQMTVRNLLEILLLHSANDAANVLAEHVSGNIDDFVNLMNQKAQELGCQNTHFVNTNGIHDENHYSTAKDLAIISHYCMQNSTFRNIVSMEYCSIPATNKFGERLYRNTNDSIFTKSKYYRSDVIGVKTGYTKQAKNCIISAAKKGDTELLAVLLYSPHLPDRYADLDTLFDYGYKVAPLIQIPEEEKVEEKTVSEIPSVSNKSLFNNVVSNSYFIIILRITICLTLSLIFLFLLYKILKK